MLKELGDNSRTSTIFVDHSPGGMTNVRNMVLQAMAAGNIAAAGGERDGSKKSRPM
jgi:hypothetical protein